MDKALQEKDTTMITNKPLSAEELLPCPFCGGAAEKYSDSEGIWNVLCMSEKCGASLHCQAEHHMTAKKAWNTRAQVQQAALSVGDLQARCEKLVGSIEACQVWQNGQYIRTDLEAAGGIIAGFVQKELAAAQGKGRKPEVANLEPAMVWLEGQSHGGDPYAFATIILDHIAAQAERVAVLEEYFQARKAYREYEIGSGAGGALHDIVDRCDRAYDACAALQRGQGEASNG